MNLRPDIKTKYEKYLFGDFLQSPWKVSQKKKENLSFIVDFKLSPTLMYNISGVRNYVNNFDWKVVKANYVCYEEFVQLSNSQWIELAGRSTFPTCLLDL